MRRGDSVFLAGWHDRGDTLVTLGNGAQIQLPGAMSKFAEQIMAERDHWKKLAEYASAGAQPVFILLSPELNDSRVGTQSDATTERESKKEKS